VKPPIKKIKAAILYYNITIEVTYPPQNMITITAVKNRSNGAENRNYWSDGVVEYWSSGENKLRRHTPGCCLRLFI